MTQSDESDRTKVSPNLGVDEEVTQLKSFETQENVVDWNGPDDPENPLNWPAKKTFGHVIIVAVLSMVV